MLEEAISFDLKNPETQVLDAKSLFIENMKRQLGFIYDPSAQFDDMLPEDWYPPVKHSPQVFPNYEKPDAHLNIAIWRFAKSLIAKKIPRECDLSVPYSSWEHKVQSVQRYGSAFGIPAPMTKDGVSLPYKLVFNSAGELLFSLRVEPLTLEHLLWMLTKSGVYFKTARIFRDNHLTPRRTAPESTLTIHQPDYEFTTEDLLRYHDDVKRFVHGPRGRAALTAGGLVGRNARDVVPRPVLLERIQAGPSDDVVYIRKNWIFKKGDEEFLYDNILIFEGKQIILGVFLIPNKRALFRRLFHFIHVMIKSRGHKCTIFLVAWPE